MTSRAAPRLGAWRLAAFAAPQVFLAALYFPVFAYLPSFYAEERGVSLEALGLIFIAARLLDAVTDPVMGWLSDRLNTRFGRRKLWLALSTPLVVLAVWRAMAPPEAADAAYVALWLTALTLAWTVALTPYLAWSAELAEDYAGRTRVAAWREAAFLIGTLGAAALYAQSGGGGAGLGAVALAVGFGLPLTALAALLAAPEPRDRSSAPPLGLAEGLAAVAANAPFRILLASNIANSAANALPAALFLFFAGSVLGLDAAAAGGLLALYFLTGVLAAPLWSWAAARGAKHRLWGGVMIAAALVFAAVPLLGAGDILLFGVICAVTGVAFGADLILPAAMQADVVDVDTAATGRQRTGLYMAFWSISMKASSAVAGGLGLLALGQVGFVAGAANTPDALLALALLYALVPAALKLLAVALIWRYPLDAAAQEALRRRIADAVNHGADGHAG